MNRQTKMVIVMAASLLTSSLLALIIVVKYQRPESALAALLTNYTNNGAPASRAKAGATNIIVLDVGLPDAWNGVTFVADIVKKAGSATFYQGASLTALPALGTTSGIGYKQDGTAGFQGTEQVVRDLDADSVYTSAADTLVDGDGSATSGAGSVSASIDVGGALVAMGNNIAQGGNAVCTNSLTTPTAVRIDTDGNCGNGGSNNGTYILGTSATAAGTEVTSAWAFATSVAMGGDGDAAYDNGEDIFIENVAGELTYSDSADTNIYSLAGLSVGDALVDFAADCDGAGAGTQACKYTGPAPLNATGSVVVDQGTAGGAAPNSTFDYQVDQLRGMGVQNSGTAVNATDIAAVKAWQESGATAGFQSAEDVSLGTMTVSSVNNKEWRLGSLTSSIPAGGTRIYVTVDLTGTPTNNTLLTFAVPVYTDVGSDAAVTQDGDVGFFVASTNDGPTNSTLLNSASQVIDTSSPTLTENTPVASPTNDTTPAYSFISSEAGTISYAGDCSSGTTAATAGANNISFNALAPGLHNNCTIRVTDQAGNISSALTVSAFTIDVIAPSLSEVVPIPTYTNDTTPDYVFSSNETGTITYGGDCASSTPGAAVGNNTVTFNILAQGLHNNCTIRVTDAAGNQSSLLTVSAFTVDTDAPTLSEVTPVPTKTLDQTPNYTFSSTEVGTITYWGDCSSATTAANAGNTTVTFNTLADGLHSNCEIRVTDPASNPSAILYVSTFEVDTTSPSVLNVTSSSPNGEYGPGAAIAITITFNENVFVEGAPRLQLETGDTDRYATYETGNGTDTLTFDYYVQTGDESLDLDYLGTDALSLNGGTIKDAAHNPAVLTLPTPGVAGSLSANKALIIVPATTDTTAPFVNNVFGMTADGPYAAGSVITILMHWSEAVEVTDAPTLTLNTTPTPAIATYVSGSGDHELLFRFTVASEMRSEDLDYLTISSLSLAGGTIKDLAGNDADLTLPSPGGVGSLSANAAIVVDSIMPELTESSAIATHTNDPTPDYIFTSTEPGTILYSGGCTGAMTNALIGSNTITFNTLSDGLYDTCVIRVRDVANNTSADLLVTPFTVNTSVPTVLNVTSAATNGLYGIGAVIPIQIGFDEIVIVSGVPELLLETGASDAMVSYTDGSGTSTLTFNYTVTAGHSTSRLDYFNASSLTMDGGSIEDEAGNSATLLMPVPGTAGSLGSNKNISIHTTRPILTEVTPVFTPTTNTTPEYVFNSTEAGTITYGGNCSSTITVASVGDNIISFSSLTAGAHNNCTITVTDPANNASLPLAVTPFTVTSADQSGYVNLVISAIRLVKSAEPPSLPAEGMRVTYYYEVFNNGNTHLHNISLTDDQCFPVKYESGDTDYDGALDLAEIWKYSCWATLEKSTTNTATVTSDQNGRIISDSAELYVPVTELGTRANVSLEKSAVPAILPAGGGDVTFTYRASNPGNIHLTDLKVTDDLCSPVEYASGDIDTDGKLDPDEIWTYYCTSKITELTVNHGRVTGIGAGLTVTDEAQVTVSLAESVEDIHEDEQIKTGLERWLQLGVSVHGLIKAVNQPAVYYLGADGLAHAFPHERVFLTWYCDYSQVSLVPASFLEQLLFGAEVGYAPGVKMIKRPSDPKVYAIEKGNIIRWVKNQKIATELYGRNWNKMIVDVPNFAGYTLGPDISSKADYDPLTARQSVTYPSDGLNIEGYTDSPPGKGLVCK